MARLNKKKEALEELSFKERISKLEECYDIFQSYLRNFDTDISRLNNNVDRYTKSCEKLWIDIRKTLKEQSESLKEIANTNSNIDETQCNVLLAIRQNEYLQAQYEAQHGYSAMKVIGTHPCKIKNKNKVHAD